MPNSEEPVDNLPSGPGRPPHKPTKATRETVELCRAGGMTVEAVAVVVGVSVPTLEKHYAQELSNGAAKKRAKWLASLNKAAAKGNASAIRLLLSLNPPDDGVPKAPEQPQAAKPAAPEGKKEQQQAAAEAVVSGDASWSKLLKPSTTTH